MKRHGHLLKGWTHSFCAPRCKSVGLRAVRVRMLVSLINTLLSVWAAGMGQTQRNPVPHLPDTTPPRIWTNIQSGDIYLIWAPPTILVNVTDDIDPCPFVEILLNDELCFSGVQVDQPGIYYLEIRARDASGNQSRISRLFQVDDYITVIGVAHMLYWRREGRIVEAIVIQRVSELHIDPHTKGIVPQVAMCEYVPTSLTLLDRRRQPVGELRRFGTSPYIKGGYTRICCELNTPIPLGDKKSAESVVAHFRGEVREDAEIAFAELGGFGEDTSNHAIISISLVGQLESVPGWQAIVEELNRLALACPPGNGGGNGGGGGNNNDPCRLPRARLTKRLIERCPPDECRQTSNEPYSCLPCFTLNGSYCSGHIIGCAGAECDGFAEARDNSRPCYASTIGNAYDYATWRIKMEIDEPGDCPCNYHMRVETRPMVHSKGSISWGGDGTLALSAGAVFVVVTGACSLECSVRDAVGVGSIEGTEVNLGVSRGPEGGSGSVSIPIRIGQGRHYDETMHSHCACEGPGTVVRVGVSSAARVQATANGPIGAYVTVSSTAEVSTKSNTSVEGIIRCDVNRNPQDGKETEIRVGPVRIP